MQTVLIVVHIIIVAALIGVILLQKSEGGALGIGGGSSGGGFMTARGTANLLTRLTGILAALFFISSMGLALYFKGAHESKSILEDDKTTVSTPAEQTAPQTEESKAAVPVSK